MRSFLFRNSFALLWISHTFHVTSIFGKISVFTEKWYFGHSWIFYLTKRELNIWGNPKTRYFQVLWVSIGKFIKVPTTFRNVYNFTSILGLEIFLEKKMILFSDLKWFYFRKENLIWESFLKKCPRKWAY